MKTIDLPEFHGNIVAAEAEVYANNDKDVSSLELIYEDGHRISIGPLGWEADGLFFQLKPAGTDKWHAIN